MAKTIIKTGKSKKDNNKGRSKYTPKSETSRKGKIVPKSNTLPPRKPGESQGNE